MGIQQLREMSTAELLRLLITDPSKGHVYRPEVYRRIPGHDGLLDAIFNGQSLPSPQDVLPTNQEDPDIRPYLSRLHENYLEVVKMLLNSAWDGEDPEKRMTSQHEDVYAFLESLAWRQQGYHLLHEKAQGKLNAIIDSYGRWWRKRNPNR